MDEKYKQILSLRRDFLKNNGRLPNKLFLNVEDFATLKQDVAAMCRLRVAEIKESSLCPDLLPEPKKQPELSYGCVFYGMALFKCIGEMRCEK